MDCLERIRTLLEERGWSVYRLAQEAGVPQSTLANLFLRNNMPTVPTLERICQALGITMAEFFSQQPTLPPEEELTAQLLEEWAALSPAQKRLVLELVHQPGKAAQLLQGQLNAQLNPILHQAATSMRLVAMRVTFSATMAPTLPSSWMALHWQPL